MRLYFALFAILLALPVSSRAEIAIGTRLTVILDLAESHSATAVQMMRSEVSHLLRGTGVHLEFALRSELAPNQDFEDLVLVRFRGDCRMTGLAPLLDERGPLAWSHTIEGGILPFGEVFCDKVRRAIEPVLYAPGGHHTREIVFGRALGRVVAHELYHMIGATHRHGKKGVAQATFSGQELVADQMEIEREDLHRIVNKLQQRSRTVSSLR